MIDFTNIEYLKSGNVRQQKAYIQLEKLRIFEKLKNYNPILTGTIPIGIDLPNSDLDIICECYEHVKFYELVSESFANEKNFEISSKNWNGVKSTIAKFQSDRFEIEIFGQPIPTEQQNAYKHMILEYKILTKMGSTFKAQIKKLKKEGLKTEPAFAKLLGLSGNPYEELLLIEI
ncbi:MAG: DUF4269 domain-containing protein [Cyclobacteriaceae bacterium]|nr:DUF4269 domain-containing protein [Cyclobacteriaceae bacterium]